ncbi:MAG: ferredoxin--NADP(+) reductase [Rhizobacter sp.]|nr:ferredoxin--NADP(+) reductase [Rhizobacter sp.]
MSAVIDSARASATGHVPPADPVHTDVVIVGAGPVGLFGVFQCGMLKMRCHVVDTLDAIGGQCTALYPDKPIYDIPGFPAVNADDLVAHLERQAAPFAPVYHLGTTANRLRTLANGDLEVTLSNGRVLVSRAVIIAAGGGTLGPNRPPLAGIEGYEGGGGVIYRVPSLAALRGKCVVVAGGGDSAVDWANLLHGVASRVMLVHRRAKFRAAPASVDALMMAVERGKVELVTPCQLHSLQGDGSRLSAVTVVDDAGRTRDLQADTLLALFGISTQLGPIGEWGLELDHQQIVATPPTCRTSMDGVFAVGDVAAYEHKLKLILTGFAEVATAAHAIYPRVHPQELLHFEHSTTVGVPPLPHATLEPIRQP